MLHERPHLLSGRFEYDSHHANRGSFIFQRPTGRIRPTMDQKKQPHDQSVSELVRRAQEGDEAAFSQLFDQYSPLLESFCSRHAADAPSEQELRSEVIAAFWDAIQAFDTQRESVTFGLYAKVCLGHRMTDCLRKWKKIKPLLSLDSDEIAQRDADEDSNPAHYVVQQENYLELIRKTELFLSPKERRVWLLFVEGNTAAEIAKELKIEKKDAENAIFRARKKLRQRIPPRA